ncbi:MAG: hypothetical protein IT359_10130 [Gemmatimonadaceae bacterium]|nr:hypothetical protein [Gemmatimonadaceae bacterium]
MQAQRVDTLRFRVEWEVVEGRHPLADSLGELSGIALDARGNVYVSDFSATTVWILDAGGRSVGRVGRKGRGPGEFEAPTGIAVAPDGNLVVRDINRVTTFAPDPATGRLAKYEGAFAGPSMADWRSTFATRFDAQRRLYYPAFNVANRTKRSGVFYIFAPDGRLTDSLVVPPFPGAPAPTARVQTSATGGRMLRGLSHAPFAPLPSWDVTPRGTLVSGMGNRYEVQETDARGALVRRYTRALPPEPIPPPLRRDSLAALRQRLDSVPVPLERVQGMPPDVREGRIPERFPAFMAVHAAADGMLWIRRWSLNPRESVFDVFASDGTLRHVVILPRPIVVQPTPVLSLTRVAAIGIDADTGANTVIVLRAMR